MPNYVTPAAIVLHIVTRLTALERLRWKRNELELLLGWQTETKIREHLAAYLNRQPVGVIIGEFFRLPHDQVIIFTDIPRLYTVRVKIEALNPGFKVDRG